jgi:hypothetical protein
MALRERGFRDERHRNGKWWIGIGLKKPRHGVNDVNDVNLIPI